MPWLPGTWSFARLWQITFSLNIGTSFALSLDNKGKETPNTSVVKKKVTPSSERRSAKRREEFLNKKTTDTENETLEPPEKENVNFFAEKAGKVHKHDNKTRQTSVTEREKDCSMSRTSLKN